MSDTTAQGLHPLQTPPTVLEAEAGVEFVRFWISGRDAHIAVRIGQLGDTEVTQWGMILADLTTHIVKGLMSHAPAAGEEDLRAALDQAYRARLDSGESQHHITLNRLN